MPGVTDAGDGAPTSLSQNLTRGAFQNQYEIFVSSCKTCSETRFQAGIYATARLTMVRAAQPTTTSYFDQGFSQPINILVTLRFDVKNTTGYCGSCAGPPVIKT
jgi:hypothetical protein